LDFKEIVLPNGDVYDKLVVRVLEIIESNKIVRQCLEKLTEVPGPILNNVKEISPGEGIGRYEAPRGEVFHYIRSDGSNRPIRHKVRAPSYVNIPTFTASCKGIPVADALITLASVDPCYCCTERSLKIHNSKHQPITVDLLKLSREKTERIRREIHGG
jgi:NADH-quinone oxidoreductase subunit D